MQKDAVRMAWIFIIAALVFAAILVLLGILLHKPQSRKAAGGGSLQSQSERQSATPQSRLATPKTLPQAEPKVSTDLRVEAWFSSQGEFGNNLQPMLEEIGKRLEEEPEGASHLPEGVSEGSYHSLFRWSIYEQPFAGTPPSIPGDVRDGEYAINI